MKATPHGGPVEMDEETWLRLLDPLKASRQPTRDDEARASTLTRAPTTVRPMLDEPVGYPDFLERFLGRWGKSGPVAHWRPAARY